MATTVAMSVGTYGSACGAVCADGALVHKSKGGMPVYVLGDGGVIIFVCNVLTCKNPHMIHTVLFNLKDMVETNLGNWPEGESLLWYVCTHPDAILN